MSTLTFEIPHGLARRLAQASNAINRHRAAREIRRVRAEADAGEARETVAARARKVRDRELAYVPPLCRPYQPDPNPPDVCGRHGVNEVCTCGT